MDVMSDDGLGLILERVGSHVSLIRAAAVCRRWRRAIADAAFLRRFRSLHAPPVAGYFHNASPYQSSVMGVEAKSRHGPVFVPSSPPLVDARHFSLDFLPNGGSWTVQDSRGSLLLIGRVRVGTGAGGLPDMLVCEPLTRHYTMVPQLPDFDVSCRFLEAFLIDGDTDKAGGCIGMSNFRVLYMLYRGLAGQAAVFTMGESGSTSWSEKSVDIATRSQFECCLGHAGGSWYFYVKGRAIITLDGSTGEFSRSQLPVTETQELNMWDYNFYVTEGRDSKPRFFTAFDDNIKVFTRLGSGDWVLEKRIMLSEATRSLLEYRTSFFSRPLNILTLGVGFIILSPGCERPWPFSVDLETMKASPAAGDMGLMVYRCELPWPPALHAAEWYAHALVIVWF
ncbi:unnamed protein product [Urochloa decumbens]|uniref:F-box domain-containing protein n=1 Tax=Urochloa decumbens TaxID=240449 RepID=A0ABC8VXC2_9POAL